MTMFASRSKPPIDKETAEWIHECFEWLLLHRGGLASLRRTPLVLPTRQYFTHNSTTGHALAEHIFSQVRSHAGLREWPCRLVAQAPTPNRKVGEFWTIQGGPSAPAGTFRRMPGSDIPIVTYDPCLLDDPLALVATFAHELAHYVIDRISEPPPGGSDLHEFAADVTAVHLGFGVFVANTSFRFAQFADAFAQGWAARRQGYLSGRELAYALAVFVWLRADGESAAADHLARDYRSAFKRGLKYLRTRPQLRERIARGPDAVSA